MKDFQLLSNPEHSYIGATLDKDIKNKITFVYIDRDQVKATKDIFTDLSINNIVVASNYPYFVSSNQYRNEAIFCYNDISNNTHLIRVDISGSSSNNININLHL